jgi:hypothetical protein
MTRLAAGLLIAGAVLAMNGLFLREADAGETVSQLKPAVEAGEVRGNVMSVPTSRILALLPALERLHSAAGADKSKV